MEEVKQALLTIKKGMLSHSDKFLNNIITGVWEHG